MNYRRVMQFCIFAIQSFSFSFSELRAGKQLNGQARRGHSDSEQLIDSRNVMHFAHVWRKSLICSVHYLSIWFYIFLVCVSHNLVFTLLWCKAWQGLCTLCILRTLCTLYTLDFRAKAVALGLYRSEPSQVFLRRKAATKSVLQTKLWASGRINWHREKCLRRIAH